MKTTNKMSKMMGTMNRKIEDDGVNTYKGVNDATIGMMIGQCEQNHG
jgi:hypothetical protein